ncbi:hypothetical protein C7G83_09920 [Siccibacter turicensis]|uniref:Uncharacterized protein n=1 Tax=Siccibacter turicensis TaxID=357233 RepID=A0A2P8VLD6_9ENTR|nr:hypothetical protein C7G83_09920 [Siccibacter turicensis]
MLKSVAQLALQPIYYDGVHAIPINECVNYSAHGTDLMTINAVSCAVAPCSGPTKLREIILYRTTGDVVSQTIFIF